MKTINIANLDIIYLWHRLTLLGVRKLNLRQSKIYQQCVESDFMHTNTAWSRTIFFFAFEHLHVGVLVESCKEKNVENIVTLKKECFFLSL